MKHERMRCIVGENNIGVPKMQNNYGAIKLLTFLILSSNFAIETYRS